MLVKTTPPPLVVNRLLAAGALVLSLAAAIWMDIADVDETRNLDPFGISVLVAMSALLLFRLRRPVLTFVTVVAISTPYHLLGYPHEATMVAICVAAFSAGRYGRTQGRVLGGAVVLAAFTARVMTDDGPSIESDVLLPLGWLLVALLAGQAIRYQRDWIAAVTARIERERADQAERAVEEERIRLARDLHDVLAHGITGVNAQAAVAAHLIDQLPDQHDPALARLSQALHGVSAASRSMLNELRAILDMLYGNEPEPSEPTPRLSRLHTLVEMAEAAGVTIDVEGHTGTHDDLPSPVDIVAYRIIQESLTNVIRHSAAQRAAVRIEQVPGELRLQVLDEGPARHTEQSSEGLGIRGMTGRAQAIGGKLTAAPREAGGFEVQAVLPLPPPRHGQP